MTCVTGCDQTTATTKPAFAHEEFVARAHDALTLAADELAREEDFPSRVDLAIAWEAIRPSGGDRALFDRVAGLPRPKPATGTAQERAFHTARMDFGVALMQGNRDAVKASLQRLRESMARRPSPEHSIQSRLVRACELAAGERLPTSAVAYDLAVAADSAEIAGQWARGAELRALSMRTAAKEYELMPHRGLLRSIVLADAKVALDAARATGKGPGRTFRLLDVARAVHAEPRLPRDVAETALREALAEAGDDAYVAHQVVMAAQEWPLKELIESWSADRPIPDRPSIDTWRFHLGLTHALADIGRSDLASARLSALLDRAPAPAPSRSGRTTVHRMEADAARGRTVTTEDPIAREAELRWASTQPAGSSLGRTERDDMLLAAIEMRIGRRDEAKQRYRAALRRFERSFDASTSPEFRELQRAAVLAGEDDFAFQTQVDVGGPMASASRVQLMVVRREVDAGRFDDAWRTATAIRWDVERLPAEALVVLAAHNAGRSELLPGWIDERPRAGERAALWLALAYASTEWAGRGPMVWMDWEAR